VRKFLVLSFFCLVLFSCENNVPLEELDFSFDKKVYINAYAKDSVIGYYLYFTQSVLDDALKKPIINHKCRIFKNGILTDLVVTADSFGLARQDPFLSFEVYSSLISEGNTYTLEIEVPEYETVYAQTTIPEKVNFERVSITYEYSDFNNNYYTLIYKLNDNPDENNFYYLSLFFSPNFFLEPYLSSEKEDHEERIIFTDKSLNRNYLTLHLVEPKISKEYDLEFYVGIGQIDSVFYLHNITSEYQNKMNESPEYYSFEPINIYSNVVNGLGYFRSYGLFNYDTIRPTDLIINIEK